MRSKTSMVAAQYRLQEWAAQVRECQSRPAGMSVVSWCTCHGITKADYYYRLRRVREACLENCPGETPLQQIVPVGPEVLRQEENRNAPRAGGHRRGMRPGSRSLLWKWTGRSYSLTSRRLSPQKRPGKIRRLSHPGDQRKSRGSGKTIWRG